MLNTTRPTTALASLVVAVALLSGCSAEVTGPNRPPRAVAGPDQECEPGQAVVLDGAASWDPDGDPITYRWRQLTAPGGAPTSLEVGPPVGLEPTQARLVPDRPGTWLIALTVTDGRLESERDVVRVLVRGRPCQTDLECSDGLFCNGQERCLEGICRTGQPVDCSQVDGPCTQGVCDEDSDTCSGEPRPAGTACDDGLFCTRDDTCDADGACTGLPRGCPAGGACEQAVCNEDLDACGLETIPDGQACDDGLYCTDPDTCTGGVCAGPDRLCPDPMDPCQQPICDEAADQCDLLVADDGTPCDDGSACTTDDQCTGGTCNGTGVACPLGCNEAEGRCYQLDPGNADPTWLCVDGADELRATDGAVAYVDTDAGTIGGQTVATFQVIDQGAGLPELAVFSFATIDLADNSQLIVVGSRSLVLLACQAATINGTITADAVDRAAGPGGWAGGRGTRRDGYDRPVAAEAGLGPSGSGGGPGEGEWDNPYRESGGGGGGHGRSGGDGGDAEAQGYFDHSGGAGGGPRGQPGLEPLAGGAGGGGAGSYNVGGDGGGGGGAIQISAGGTITIGPNGGLSAAGAGGGVSSWGNYGGGGGGGAGGAILLEAPAIDIQGTLTTNAGGGAGGRTDYPDWNQDCPGGTPSPGENGPFTAQRAAGGLDCDASGGPPSGPGGQGGALVGADGDGERGGNGLASGGGGGGAGRIRVNTHQDAGLTLSGVTSPDCGDEGGQQTSCSRGAIGLW